MISKDIEELCKERLALETDIAQKEADIKIKTGEIKNLQVIRSFLIFLLNPEKHNHFLFIERTGHVSRHSETTGKPKRRSAKKTQRPKVAGNLN